MILLSGQTHSFSAALNTKDSCLGVNYVMAKVTKSGNSSSIEVVEEKSNIDLETYARNWSVNTPNHDGDHNNFTTEVSADTLFVDVIRQTLIENFWKKNHNYFGTSSNRTKFRWF